MLCQNCHKNEATIHLYTNVNGRRTEVNLCQNCYQLLKNQQLNNNNGNGGARMAQDPFGFGNLDDIFRAMQGGNVSRPEDMYGQQVPPTQAGRGGGNNPNGGNGSSLLGQNGLKLTDLAKKGKIDPVIGRDKEN